MDTFVLDLFILCLKKKIWLNYKNLFFSNECKKDDKTILKYFQWLRRLRWKKYVAIFVVSIKNIKPQNIVHFRKNISSFHFCSKCGNEDEKTFKEE